MCRFTFFMGEEISVADLVTRPKNSLIRSPPIRGTTDTKNLFGPIVEHQRGSRNAIISSEPLEFSARH